MDEPAEKKYIDTLRILYSISMSPTIQIEDSPNDRHKLSTSSIHKLPLILWKEIGPHMDPMSSSVHNLQKMIMTSLLKITSLRQFHNAQMSAHTPTRILSSIFLSIPLSLHPNKFFILAGGGILKVKCTTCQTILANGR
jgi:hypothetical protein